MLSKVIKPPGSYQQQRADALLAAFLQHLFPLGEKQSCVMRENWLVTTALWAFLGSSVGISVRRELRCQSESASMWVCKQTPPQRIGRRFSSLFVVSKVCGFRLLGPFTGRNGLVFLSEAPAIERS